MSYLFLEETFAAQDINLEDFYSLDNFDTSQVKGDQVDFGSEVWNIYIRVPGADESGGMLTSYGLVCALNTKDGRIYGIDEDSQVLYEMTYSE